MIVPIILEKVLVFINVGMIMDCNYISVLMLNGNDNFSSQDKDWFHTHVWMIFLLFDLKFMPLDREPNACYCRLDFAGSNVCIFKWIGDHYSRFVLS